MLTKLLLKTLKRVVVGVHMGFEKSDKERKQVSYGWLIACHKRSLQKRVAELSILKSLRSGQSGLKSRQTQSMYLYTYTYCVCIYTCIFCVYIYICSESSVVEAGPQRATVPACQTIQSHGHF